MSKWRTKAGVFEVELVESKQGLFRVVALPNGDAEVFWGGAFDQLFEPADSPPADDGTVMVKRETVLRAARLADERGCPNLAKDLRAALGGKAKCNHSQAHWSDWDEATQTNQTFRCKCGMVRTLGAWHKPEAGR